MPDKTSNRPRLLIEDWLPAQAVGVECMRERATGQQPPDKRLHVWFARRPLSASRAAVLASLLPANFDHDAFERLMGFYASASTIVANEETVNLVRAAGKGRIANPHGRRAFNAPLPAKDVEEAHDAMRHLWGEVPTVIDTMAGGGAIPLEAARLGLDSRANEYNPVACVVLDATTDAPLRHGAKLGAKARQWGKVWRERFNARMEPFFGSEGVVPPFTYLYARTVPCPDTEGHPPTPLVPDWSLLKLKGGRHLVAEPRVLDAKKGTWTIAVREIGKGAGQLHQAPQPTYAAGSGISIFSGKTIPSDYIQVMAQQGEMGSSLYAVATKVTTKLEFRPAEKHDLDALRAAEKELAHIRPRWERDGMIPTEAVPRGSKTGSDDASRGTDLPLKRGEKHWADMFAPRQLLSLGTLVEELHGLRTEIVRAEGEELGEAIMGLLAVVVDKCLNYNSNLASWHASHQVIRSVFDRHDFSFKSTFTEMPLCVAGGGLIWAIDSVIEAYEKVAALPRAEGSGPVTITQGSATSLLHLDDKSVTAVVVDPPYADNVQYSELADFFYVWLKRTQGHRRPEWFSTYLCDHTEEAVVNPARFHEQGEKPAVAKVEANIFYQQMMTDVFREARRVLRDDGPLTVMFTHKKQEAWAALFDSLIAAGFTITATWPVQTESQHSLHQAKKNAAQSTVILVARKRDEDAGRGYLDDAMRREIIEAAQTAAARMKSEGLNAVDQLVGAFGPAMEVFTRYSEVRTDTGETVSVAEAIQMAANAVAQWRVNQLAERGLDGVDAESRFILLCWDVLRAAEFRFNEAMLLGRAVGMDVTRLKETGLISASGDKVKLLPASERRRERAVRDEKEQQLALFGGVTAPRGRTRPSRKVHPSDEYFVSAIDMCHALALKYAESGGGQAGIGAAKGTALQQGWGEDSACARLMVALVNAAPIAVRFHGKGKAKTAADEFPEFRAWHALLQPLFGVEPPEWKEPVAPQATLVMDDDEDEDDDEEADEE